jgi:carbon monoxide dehydrogenase subunit G
MALEVTASAMVPAPPDQVFGLISETSRYPEWVTGTDAVTRTDGPASEGSTYDEINPILGPWKAKTHWRVVEHDAPRRSRHETGDIPLSSHFQVVMEVAAEGDGSRVTITLRGEPSMGPLGAGFAALMRGQVDRDNRSTVQAFAELATRELSAQQARA